jgi:hypothetical protein
LANSKKLPQHNSNQQVQADASNMDNVVTPYQRKNSSSKNKNVPNHNQNPHQDINIMKGLLQIETPFIHKLHSRPQLPRIQPVHKNKKNIFKSEPMLDELTGVGMTISVKEQLPTENLQNKPAFNYPSRHKAQP